MVKRTHLTPAEIAGRLGIATETVLGWIHARELRAINVGSERRPRYRVAETDLDTFLEARALAAPVQPIVTPRPRNGHRLPRTYV